MNTKSREKASAVEGTAIVWLRNDLRVHDNEAFLLAVRNSEMVVPIYCFDPRNFGKTNDFGFAKTGAFRAQFIIEAVEDLRSRLRKLGSNLIVRSGKPEEIIPNFVSHLAAKKVYAQKETCDEEIRVEEKVQKALSRLSSPSLKPKLEFVWGSTMYHIEDLPFLAENVPDVYTQFRKAVEGQSKVRAPLKMPKSFPVIPDSTIAKIGGQGSIPQIQELGLDPVHQGRGALTFIGGESAALNRLDDYFWKKNLLRVYKETRNGMLGADYSTKFSPWLAHGCLSPRFIHSEVIRYEKEREANESTYWVLFELIWRDYFRFLSIKCGNSIFHLGGPQKAPNKQTWSTNKPLFETWKTGTTGYPLVDANMRELAATGFMSNRGRQIVCSFLTRDMGMDWRMGAEYFESLLLDYDPASNYGNWTYGAGVGNDPREDRYFSIPKQAKSYDPEGDYVAHWIPILAKLPPKARHAPHLLSPAEKGSHGWSIGEDYPRPIVPLKFGSMAGWSSPPGSRESSGNRKRSENRGRGRGGTSARF